ncbi:MAG: FecR domain-containing protein [Limnobacter sp.]|nr:FecR domain-containing protein [Limnobacter sp.]
MIRLLKPAFRSIQAATLAICLGATPAYVWAQTKSPFPSDAPVNSSSSKKVVGEIKSITGVVSLQTAEGKSKFASTGTKLNVGDIINTQKKSGAVLLFVDTTQIALRPSTQFVVENYEYQPEQPIADKAEFKLVKGGLRTLTGLIGKRGTSDAFSMKSETATIGIRGTDFSARICKGRECEDLAKGESEREGVTNLSTVGAAGRLSQVNGEITAKAADGKQRKLVKGSAVFAGDVITSSDGGFAVISLADGGRLTVPGGGQIEIAAYRYSPESPKTSVASFQLLKGAVRAVTGAIAKAEPSNVKFFTQTATVGIRGTAFDMSCTTGQSGDFTFTQCSTGSSLNVEMREGSTQITTPAGNLVLNQGQSAFVLPTNLIPNLSPQPLNILNKNPSPGPLPESTPANFETLSSTPMSDLGGAGSGNSQNNQTGPAGGPDSNELYVAVNDGTVIVRNGNDRPVEVNRGEGAIVRTFTNLPPVILNSPPQVLSRDATLSAPAFVAPQCAP